MPQRTVSRNQCTLRYFNSLILAKFYVQFKQLGGKFNSLLAMIYSGYKPHIQTYYKAKSRNLNLCMRAANIPVILHRLVLAFT